MLKKNFCIISSSIRWPFNWKELEVQSEVGTWPVEKMEKERFDGRCSLGGLLITRVSEWFSSREVHIWREREFEYHWWIGGRVVIHSQMSGTKELVAICNEVVIHCYVLN